jgi:hypothetical protein
MDVQVNRLVYYVGDDESLSSAGREAVINKCDRLVYNNEMYLVTIRLEQLKNNNNENDNNTEVDEETA